MSKEFETVVWNGHKIRFVEQEWDDLGLTWINKVEVVAKDICDALGIKKPKKVLESLPESYHFKWTSNEGKTLEVLTEKGLYRLIFQSTSPEAENFQDWVLEVIQKMRLQSDMGYWQTLQIMDEEKQKDLFELLDPETMADHPIILGELGEQEIPFVNQQGRWWTLLDKASSVMEIDPELLDGRFMTWCDLDGYEPSEMLLSEEGIYQALLMSETEEAKRFQDWVYSLIKRVRQSKEYEVPEILDMVRDSVYWKINEELMGRC